MASRKTAHAETTAAWEEVELIVEGEHSDPFHVLGAHAVAVEGKPAVAVRAFLPGAAKVWVIRGAAAVAAKDENFGDPAVAGSLLQNRDPIGARRAVSLQAIHPEGFFEAVFTDEANTFPYRLRAEGSAGHTWEFDDPYRFPPVLTDYDLHLLGEGTHYRNWEKLGAHIVELEGVAGVVFAVWAPTARRVSVVGDFNAWDGRRHPMRARGGSGIWELFVPGLAEGDVYKYEIKSRDSGRILLKADPFAFFSELRPKTASIVHDIDRPTWIGARYEWRDQEWMSERPRRQALSAPISVYEVHLGSWRRVAEEANRPLTYRESAEQLADYAGRMGYTHVELLPVMEHPLDESWGYQVTGYFAPTSRFGTPEDFMYFVDCLHQKGIGVLVDWVPAHFPADAHGLSEFDGTHLYDHADPRRGEHKDWGTRIFNYARTEVRSFLWNSALFWLEKYHVDGLRVDAVASMLYLDYSRRAGEWIPNPHGGNEDLDAISFLKRLNELIHERHPGVLTIAEESTSWTGVSRPTHVGGLGFSLKWNMGWMHDTLLYFSKEPIHRKFHHNNLTFSLLYAFTENFVLVLSHDEVVHGKRALLAKMPGDSWQQFANLRALYAFQYAHPGKKLLFMGGEFGQWMEWNANQSLDWNLLDYDPHRALERLVADLNLLHRRERALHEVDFDWTGFEWVDFQGADESVIVFLRRARHRDDHLVVASNFTPVPRRGYRIGVPEARFYAEALNTDAVEYGGSGVVNAPRRGALEQPWHNQPCSLELDLPPLSVVILKPQGQT
ncbi:MAG: 1,4-alpha-glucan branching enzyme [Acidobacteria bacterium]|nr:MAG: 1,4-alpha-glucan branching enzyme [Acidobacteriota bacterium]